MYFTQPDQQMPQESQHFEGLHQFKDVYTIRLQPEARPFSLSAPRRVPITLHGVIQNEPRKMEMDVVIHKIDKPTDWCAGIIVVPRPNFTHHICVDLTRLNQVIKRECHTLSPVEQILGCLGGKVEVFSKLNVTAGFHHVKLSEESRELTLFGSCSFCRLSLGICFAPQFFVPDEQGP